MSTGAYGVQVLEAGWGSFARTARQVFGLDFEEIDFSSPRDSYVPNKGVDVAKSLHLEGESKKSERNLERCKGLVNKIDIYAILALGNNESKVHAFAQHLVAGGMKFFIVFGWEASVGGTEFVFAVPAGTRSADALWQEAVRISGLSGSLVRGVWKTGGGSVQGRTLEQGARLIAQYLGLLHPAWLFGKDWLVTKEDSLYTKWISYIPRDTGYRAPWGYVYNRLIPCGTPPGFQKRAGCDENDLTVSVAQHLMTQTRVVYYVQSGSYVNVPPPSQNNIYDGIGNQPPAPTYPTYPTYTGFPASDFFQDRQKMVLVGGIALLFLVGIILVSR